MATAASNPIRPKGATYAAVAFCSVTDFRTTCAAGSVVQFANEDGEQIGATKSFDYIAQFTLGTEDPEDAGTFDLNAGTHVFGASGALVVTFDDMLGGGLITCTGTLSMVTSAETNCSRTAPGTATISGYTLLGASGDNPYAWTQA